MNTSTSKENKVNQNIQNELQNLYYDSATDLSKKTISYRKVDTLSTTTIGLLGYSFACFTYAITTLELTNYDTTSIAVFGVCGGLCQYICGIFQWYKGENLNSYLSLCFGLFNMASPLWYYFAKFEYFKGVAFNSDAAGIFNFMYAIATIAVIIASTKSSIMSLICNCLVFISFFLQGINAYVNSRGLNMVCGICVLGISLIIGYIGISLFWTGIYDRTVLPLFYKGEKVKCCC